MKFLVDECLSPLLAVSLTQAGHESVHVLDRGLQGRPDHEVMALAQFEGRVLISADTDFGELLIRSQAVLPSLILLRGLTSRTPELASVILGNLDQIVEELTGGAIVVFTTEHIRVRHLGPDATGS